MTVLALDPGHVRRDAQLIHAGVEPSLGQLIREKLAASEEPDPRALALEIAGELPEDYIRDVIRRGVESMVRQEIRSARAKPAGPRHSSSENQAAAVLWDVYSRRYPVGDGKWKLLGDFTRDDALWNRDDYQRRADENAGRAAQFEALAKRLTRGRTVREALSPEQVETILNA